MKEKEKTRIETDAMGNVRIPDWAYWGAQTERAIDNFTVSPFRIPLPMLSALALIKREAAVANRTLGLLEPKIAAAIDQACREIGEGRFNDHFPVDVFQTGSGTSWNMNINEVVSTRANEILGAGRGGKHPVHPNDHVNLGQSSNDVIPSALNISTRRETDCLITVLSSLAEGFAQKESEFKEIIKVGRTHLQDAVPVTLGQEFSGYRTQIEKGIERLRKTFPDLEELPLGGTAVGTGINTHPEFGARVAAGIARETGVSFREAENKFEAIAARDAQVFLAGALNSLAVSLMKIANDIRLLSSGPRTGLAEIALPSLQPGSSIMPGKINPVIPEMMIQVCAHVMGKTTAVTVAGQTGPLDLQIMQPLLAFEILSALALLANACRLFDQKCVRGLTADPARCAELVELSLALVTPLALKIGYDRASKVASRAYREKRTVREIAIEEGLVSAEEAETVFDPRKMLSPSAEKKHRR